MLLLSGLFAANDDPVVLDPIIQQGKTSDSASCRRQARGFMLPQGQRRVRLPSLGLDALACVRIRGGLVETVDASQVLSLI